MHGGSTEFSSFSSGTKKEAKTQGLEGEAIYDYRGFNGTICATNQDPASKLEFSFKSTNGSVSIGTSEFYGVSCENSHTC